MRNDRYRYSPGAAVVPSARDRRMARQLEAEAFALADAGDLGDPGPADEDGEGLVDVVADELFTDLTPEEYLARDDFAWAEARDLAASYAEVVATTAYMRDRLQRQFMATAGLAIADDDDDCAGRRCADCNSRVAELTRDGLCAHCALAHLEGVALVHLEAS